MGVSPYEIFLEVGLIVVLVMLVFMAIAVYLFQAIGLYKLSKNRGYGKAWLSFIPIINIYTMGEIADNIKANLSKKTCYTKTLLVLNASIIPFSILYLIINSNSIAYFWQKLEFGADNSTQIATTIVLSIIVISTAIITYIVLYRIYAEYSKQNANLFIALSILFSLHPFILFAIRNNPSATKPYTVTTQNNPQPQTPQNNF